ncbi:hypothetical protein [Deinococcus hopiensis]|uniref:Uncharacterized protein n=1 Tax=Deinococcus hopiensis KR-140 TaxID=695939 RepID=A0A1W1VH36_9DEIO|nr:hypothetical protein [Deinococcus hopiensis]SMB92553.1 hypothetical protein SAMN00790413_01625 [Deinococcus hopiensis KR-140]
MTAVLILMVIFGGVSLMKYVDTTRMARRMEGRLPDGAQERAALHAPPAQPLPGPEAVETLVLKLPPRARERAWTILCAVVDAQANSGALDARTAYLLTETRRSYLPETLRAYLNLTPGARERLGVQGQPAETLLTEQLALIEDGVREALRHDHAAADRLLAQGRFLRERFQGENAGGDLKLPG